MHMTCSSDLMVYAIWNLRRAVEQVPIMPPTPKQPHSAPLPHQYPVGAGCAGRGGGGVGIPALCASAPQGYGGWRDWNAPGALQQEEQLAKTLGLANSQRGPAAPIFGGPESWRGIPWNSVTSNWSWVSRQQLPSEYCFANWWSEASLDAEAELAHFHLIPWALRGPPDGPLLGSPLFWRGLAWRPNSKKWMVCGGGGIGSAKHAAEYGGGGHGGAKKVGRVKLTTAFHVDTVRAEHFTTYQNLEYRHVACTKWLYHYTELS